MWDQIKTYVLEIAIKKYAPVAVAAAFTALGTYLAANSGWLEQWGITYGTWPLHWAATDGPSGHVILIELDTLSASAYTLIIALAATLIRAIQHHATGTPITTDKEKP